MRESIKCYNLFRREAKKYTLYIRIVAKNMRTGNSLAVQWLELCASTLQGDTVSIPGPEIMILHATRYGQNKNMQTKVKLAASTVGQGKSL